MGLVLAFTFYGFVATCLWYHEAIVTCQVRLLLVVQLDPLHVG